MRYLPHSAAERADMLAVIGAKTADDLFGAVPRSALLTEPVDLPAHSPEFLVEAHMRALAGQEPRRRAMVRSSSVPAPIATMCRRRSIT